MMLAPVLFLMAATPVEFNRDIRPIFSDKCFTCHGPDQANRKTALRLDTEAGAKIALSGGRSAIVPGDPAKSELFRRITSENKAIRMPPAYAGQEKLSSREIELIRRWIEQGAQWQSHWSFIPPKRPPLPANARSASQAIDFLVRRRLEREGLQPSPEADRRTLIRRLTLDLTGLPPTPSEVEAFVNDKSPNAYERVVDRLLASTRYAERMAFRWMEAARYADTNGYQTDGERDMWRWRDWVIDAFHNNMPFDQFTIEQIAGDLLPHPTLAQRIATGFNRNHRTSAEGGIVPEEFRVEYVADRVETTATVWLGLTVGCARCHDHKYDPISQKDFYRLFAFFNQVPEKGLVYNFGNEEPYVKAPTAEQQRRLSVFDAAVSKAQAKVSELGPEIEKAAQKWEEKVVRRGKALDWTVTEGLVFREPLNRRHFDGSQFVEVATEAAKFNYQDPFTFAAWIQPEQGRGAIVSRTEDYFEGAGHGLYLIDGKLRLHVIFRWTDIGLRVETVEPLKLHEWQHVMATYDGKRKASGVRLYVNGKPQQVKVLFDELTWPITSKEPIRIGAGGGLRFQGSIDDVRIYSRALSEEEASAVALRERIDEIASKPASSRTAAETAKLRLCFLERFAPERIKRARTELRRIQEERRRFYDSLPTVMVMTDSKVPRDTFVLKRGAYDAHGEKVAPGTPGILHPFPAGAPSNRLGLARWLVDRNNPLTARVIVNRYWQMLFGVGLVKTVEDFGSQGEWPLHPELLDLLAVEFMESGWNVKAILKAVVMSATYRQSSKATPELLQRDPENRLFARGPRFRLPPEMVRDQALALSGLLVEKTGGPSVKPYQPPGLWQELSGGKGYQQDHGDGLYRRSLYTYWRRTVAPPSMIIFDSPNRETCTVRQTRTNTPLQALNLMNDVTYVEAARKLAERIMREGGKQPGERVDYAYRLVLARPPSQREAEITLGVLKRFLSSFKGDRESASQLLAQGESPRARGLPAEELAAYTGVASLLLNLDETITKE